jgi:tRNA (guanine-N7-)-methyltransferase
MESESVTLTSPTFKYSHRNPYHDKLSDFEEFVIRDEQTEEYRGKWNLEVFNREAPLYLEVGSGYGHFMLEFCEKNPHVNYLGMDFRFKRSFNLARKLKQHPTQNFRFLRARGERIDYMFADSELDAIFYFFPDPWPKRKHLKKRLFQEPFLKAASKVLKPGGKLYVKTDHEGYAHWMAERIEQNKDFKLQLKTFDLHEHFPEHFLANHITKFEKIFLGQNIPIKAFVLENIK